MNIKKITVFGTLCILLGSAVLPMHVSAAATSLSWQNQTTPTGTPLSIEWSTAAWAPSISGGSGLFVSVSQNGTTTGTQVMTSPDGMNRTLRSAPVVNTWEAVTWSPSLNLFVAVGTSGNANIDVMTSPDGITWTSRMAASAKNRYSVTWSSSLSLFVAVAYDTTGTNYSTDTMVSSNGTSWTSEAAPSGSEEWNSVTWSSSLGLFVAVAANSTGNDTMISSNGTTRTGEAASVDNAWQSVTWSPTLSLFVAVADNGTTGNDIMTSSNGTGWTSRTSPAANAWYSVTWSPSLSLFVAVGGSNISYPGVMTSPDGVTWTTRIPASNAIRNGVNWSPTLNLFVATSYGSNQLMTSSDGINWTEYGTPTVIVQVPTNGNWYGSVWGSTAPNGAGGTGLFVVVGNTTLNGNAPFNAVMTSPDGVNRTTRTPAANNNWVAVAWSPSLNIFVATAISGTGNRIMTSPDGINWTTRTDPVDNNWISVVWAANAPNGLGGSGLFVAVATTWTGNRIMTSPDGINWTTRTDPVDNKWDSVTWSASLGLFVAVAYSGTGNRIMTSPDGVNRTTRTDPVDSNWESVTWADTASNGSGGTGLFVAVAYSGGGNRIMTSPDGVNWTSHSAPAANSWYYVAWADTASNGSGGTGLFVAVATTGVGNRIMTSPDGVNRTIRTDPVDNAWYSVSWSPSLNLFIADADNATTTANQIMSSPDGVTWTIQTTPTYYGPSVDWWNITWAASAPNGLGGSGLFVAVSIVNHTSVGADLMTSPDGVNRMEQTGFPMGVEPRDVTRSPQLGLFVAVIETQAEVFTSPDAVHRTARMPANATNDNRYKVVWAASAPNGLGGSGLFVALASQANANDLMTSPDGINWTERDTWITGATYWEGLDWSPSLGLFAAVNVSGQVTTSTNGITWTTRTAPAANQRYSIVWGATAPNGSGGQGLFVAIAANGTNRVMTSPDGINRTAQNAAAAVIWQRIAWSPELGLFVALASNINGSVMTSPDGVNWTLGALTASAAWDGIAWSDQLDMFAAVANSTNGQEIVTSIPANPNISSVSATTGQQTSSTIMWTTDEEGSSQVNYGTSTGYGSSSTLNSSVVFSHSVSLTGLSCDTTYHYQVISSLDGLSSSSTDSTFTTALCTGTAINSFTFASPAATGTISYTGHTVAITVPYGTSVTNLSPTITLSSGATISPISGTGEDFTTPQTYTVTAQDGVTTQAYTVTVTVALNSATQITSFAFTSPVAIGTINNTNHTIAVTIPVGSSVSSLTPYITLSTGATITPTSGTTEDFTTPQSYTVTAQDGVSNQAYIVTVTVTTPPPPALTNTFNGYAGWGEWFLAMGTTMTGTTSSWSSNNATGNTVISGQCKDGETQAAYTFAFSQGITTMQTCLQANMDGQLMRNQAAKMVVNFAENVLGKKPNLSKTCTFTDIAGEDSEMQQYATQACQLGIMWLKADGTPNTVFNSTGVIDKEQWATIVSRVLYGNKYNDNACRYCKHVQALSDAHIITTTDNLTGDFFRGRAMIMLMRAFP